LADAAQLAGWTAAEQERERRAAAEGGRYYPDTMMAVLYERLDVAKRELAGAQNQLAAALGRPAPAPEPPPPPQPGLLRRIRHDPRIRAALTRVPGARSAVLAARRWRADRAGR
jgi:hypothetical protein